MGNVPPDRPTIELWVWGKTNCKIGRCHKKKDCFFLRIKKRLSPRNATHLGEGSYQMLSQHIFFICFEKDEPQHMEQANFHG
jgi:hypothetical protein